VPRIDLTAFRIAAIYALFGVAWIVFSDDLMLAVAPDTRIMARLGTWKGLAFVLVTACVIYLAVGRRRALADADAGRIGAARGSWPLILIFILLASIIVAMGLLGVAHRVSSEKGSMYLRLQAIADLKIRQIGNWLDERQADAAMLASATIIVQSFERAGDAPGAAERARIVNRLEDYRRAYGYRAASLFDARGTTLLAAGDPPVAISATVKATIGRAIATGRVLVTDLYRVGGPDTERIGMDVVAPVSNAAGRPLAVVLHVDPRRFLYPLMQVLPVPSETAETLLFRLDADGVLFLNDLRHKPDTALKLRLPLSQTELIAVKAVSGAVAADGEVEGLDYRGERVIGVVKAVPTTHWFMVAKIDQAELYGRGTREAGWIILVDTLVLVIAAAATLLVHQRREMRLTAAREREQAERLETLRLLDSIAESSTDAIFVKDVDSRYVFLNRAAAAWLGRTREEMVGLDDTAFFPPELAASLQARDREVMASGEVRSYEATYPLVGGARTILMTKGPLRDEAGQVTGLFGIARDISERKHAEDVVHASERRFRSLFDNMLNGFAYCRMIYEDGEPVDFVYLDTNPAFARLTRLNEVAGRRVSEVIPGIRAANPELFETYGRVARGGAPERFETFVVPLGEWFLITVYSPEPGFFVAIFDVVTEQKRAESALIESEARFATVFRSSPVGIALCRLRDGQVLDANDTFLQLFGLGRDQVVGLSARELDLWADPDAVSRLEGLVHGQGRFHNLELPFRRHAGGAGIALVSGESVELGGQGYMLLMVSDISGLRAAESEARQQEAVLDSVFQTLPDLFFLLDAEGTILDYRARSDGDLYLPPEAFLGKRLADVLPPEPADAFMGNMRTVREGGGLARYEYDLEMPGTGLRRFEGRLAMPEGSDQFIAVVRDITREYLDRRALAESEERFVRALENIPDVVVIYGPDLRIRYINGATRRLTGRPVADFIGRRDDEVLPPEVCAAYLPTLTRAVETGTVQSVETELNLETGTVSLHITCVPLLDDAGKVYEILGVTHDLTDRKRAEQEIVQLNAVLEERVRERTAQLEAANKELETFAYSVSHDLKAPLRGIDGYSRLLVEECAGALNPDCRLFVANIRSGTDQMKHLIDDLLAYSRMERRALQDFPVVVADLVGKVLAERQQELAERDVRIRLDLPAETVRADPDGLLFVLRNLVDNALKFTRDAQPPAIEIGGRIEGDGPAARQIVWIKDNGIGFDMKFHERIFEIFQRLHRPEDFPGTGVGLAIVQKAMQRMKGRVWAESEPGRGATFYLELPA
jgi:PAS domain S-box-containing protein